MATKVRKVIKFTKFSLISEFFAARIVHFGAALSIIVAIFLTCRPAFMALLATFALNPEAWVEELPQNSASLRGKIQKHFLTYGIYIPLSDIVAITHETEANTRLVFVMRKSCGEGMIYAWVPVQFSIPFFGVRTFEWCWTFPRPKIATEVRSSPQQKGLL